MRRYKPFAPLLALLCIYTIYYLLEARSQPVVTMVDYWLHLQWARQLTLSNLETWVHPFYPVGYFVWLRIGLALGVDVVRHGQFLSLTGSIGCIVAVYWILYTATRRTGLSLAGVTLLTLHPFFRFQALQEGTDMLAAGLQLLALAIVFLNKDDSRRFYILSSVAAGVLIGSAYLIRYTALLLIPIVIIFLWVKNKADQRKLILSIALFTAAFGLGALPQIVASVAVTGTPFYNEQARNVWFGMYGDFNWTENWGRIPPGITLLEIVRADLQGFLSHWAHEFGRFFSYDHNAYATDPLALERKVTLWEPLLNHLLWLVGSVLLLFDKRLTQPQTALLLMALFLTVAITSMGWLFTRFLLIPLAIQVVVIVLAASQLSERLFKMDHSATIGSLLLLSAFALLFWFNTTWPVKQQFTQEMVRRVEDIQPILEAVGISQPEDLITNNRLYQDIADPTHPQYPLFQQPTNKRVPVSEFLQQIIGQRSPSYLLFDWTPHAIRTYNVHSYRSELTAAKDSLAPLQLTDEYSLYCILPCEAAEATQVQQPITPELTLAGYRAFTSQGNQHGLYLYWELQSPVDEGITLSLTLRDPSGETLFHSVRDPQQGTYPLHQWNVGQMVVDYYLFSSTTIAPDVTYELTIRLATPESSQPMVVPIIFSDPSR